MSDVTHDMTKGEVAKAFRVTPRTIENWVAENPEFPKPIKPSYKVALWDRAEVAAYKEKLRDRCGMTQK